MKTGKRLDEEKKQKLNQFCSLSTAVVAMATLLIFWTGLYVLQHDVFKDYYDPARHTIIEQDPETLEVYSWKDAAGHVFTRDSATVRFFPYGIMALILVLMGFSSGMHNFLTNMYVARLARETVPEAPVSAGQQRRAARG
jgi:hypothetical protein